MLQASLVDLADAMRKAQPIAPSMGKEEWLEKRKTQKRSVDPSKAERKVHGASGGAAEEGEARTKSTSASSLAKLPPSVPELPNAYLVRAEDLSQLKKALLSNDGSSTSLTSKKPQNKVGAHGMVSMQRVYEEHFDASYSVC